MHDSRPNLVPEIFNETSSAFSDANQRRGKRERHVEEIKLSGDQPQTSSQIFASAGLYLRASNLMQYALTLFILTVN
jgi:hypothetical protein